MIYFRGQSLENAAPVKIEDIRVSPIIRQPTVRERPILAGADFVRMRDGTRTVGITFSILEDDRDTRQRYLEAVAQWALSMEPGPLALPYHQGRLLDAICTGLPEPSTRQWWEQRLNLTFTAYDPYFYDTADKSAACGTAFSVGGDAPPRMRIERTLSSAASSQAYSDGTDTMTFSSIPAGNMVIDLNEQTAAVGSASIMQYFTFDSTFIIPRTGAQTITGTGTILWRERWKE